MAKMTAQSCHGEWVAATIEHKVEPIFQVLKGYERPARYYACADRISQYQTERLSQRSTDLYEWNV